MGLNIDNTFHNILTGNATESLSKADRFPEAKYLICCQPELVDKIDTKILDHESAQHGLLQYHIVSLHDQNEFRNVAHYL